MGPCGGKTCGELILRVFRELGGGAHGGDPRGPPPVHPGGPDHGVPGGGRWRIRSLTRSSSARGRSATPRRTSSPGRGSERSSSMRCRPRGKARTRRRSAACARPTPTRRRSGSASRAWRSSPNGRIRPAPTSAGRRAATAFPRSTSRSRPPSRSCSRSRSRHRLNIDWHDAEGIRRIVSGINPGRSPRRARTPRTTGR